MKLRTQLALTFLALTILPLGGLAGYSYYSSSKAVRSALEEEASELAGQMDRKLATARQWVSRSVENVEPIPFESLVQGEEDSERQVARRIIRSMGGAAPLVRSFEFIPLDAGTVAAVGSVSTVDVTRVTPEIASVPEAPAPPAPAPAAVPAPPKPPTVVIDLEEALREVEAEREQMKKVPVVGHSVEFAFKTLESIPFDMIMEQSMIAMEQGLTEAATEMAEEQAELDAELVSEQNTRAAEERKRSIEEQRRAIDSARERFREIVRQRQTSAGASESDRRVTVFEGAPEIPVVQDGEIVGSVRADVHEEEILREIFLSTGAQGDEIPFAIDSTGQLYTRSNEDATFLEELDIKATVQSSEESRFVHEDWIIATSIDAETGLVMGVVRPAAEALAQVRKATIRSLGLGLALVGICLIGVLPLADHMTRDIGAVTAGAERISQGDLDAEVEVDSKNEVGRLAAVFNRMAKDLRTNQQLLVEEESARRAQEVREQLLKKEYDRTASELEDARQFQLSMLPASIPEVNDLEIAVEMTTATEVGGDYYDFHADGESLTVAIGDGTGHGAKAGTMVAVIKSLFTALQSRDLKCFLRDASATIRTMQLGRMSMALTLMQIRGNKLRYATAGMPPILLVRAGGDVEELSMPGAPLGTIEFDYQEREVTIDPGDTIVAMSDGLPELPDDNGDPFGYERVNTALRESRGSSAREIIAMLQVTASEWRGVRPQNDDMTLLVMRYLG